MRCQQLQQLKAETHDQQLSTTTADKTRHCRSSRQPSTESHKSDNICLFLSVLFSVCVIFVAVSSANVKQCRNVKKQVYQLSLIDRTTKLCCRQRLTITVINYSGRLSEFGCTVNAVDRPRSSLSRSRRTKSFRQSRVWDKVSEETTLIF